jgi:hypothetical protein
MNKEYIAYQGQEYTVEWYFNANDKSPAFNYYVQLTPPERMALLRLIKRMGDAGEIKDTTKFNFEGDKIYAFKPKPDRFLCFFFEGNKIILTNAFRKKQPKLPAKEKDKALSYKKDYEMRIRRGEYYA